MTMRVIHSSIRVITKLPNSEQSNKGKVKTHKYINRQNQSTTENCENRNDPDLVQAFLKKWWVESDFKAPSLPLSLRLKVSGCHYNISCNIKISQEKIEDTKEAIWCLKWKKTDNTKAKRKITKGQRSTKRDTEN